jgi:DNA-binding NarL/FixJ family response regulator
MADCAPRTRVLVVEDEALVTCLLRDVLEDNGFEVVGLASTQEAAMKLAHRNHPDIAVDAYPRAKLKQGDGIETAKEMVREGVGVLFLTGHGWRLVTDSRLPSGVVEKPFCPESIVRAVRAIGHIAQTGEVPS